MPQRFDNRVAQVVAAVFGGLFVVIGLSGFVAGASPGTAIVYLVFGVYTIVRGQRSSLVIVEESGVTTRSMVRTRRYAWSELRGVEVAVGRTGFTGFGSEHLVFHRADGQDVVFKELNCPPPKPPEVSSVVRPTLNDVIDSRSSTPAPSSPSLTSTTPTTTPATNCSTPTPARWSPPPW